MEGCAIQTLAGIGLAVALIAAVVFIMVTRREVTWNLVAMAVVGIGLAGISYYTQVSFGPSGFEFRKEVENLKSEVSSLTKEVTSLRETLSTVRLAPAKLPEKK